MSDEKKELTLEDLSDLDIEITELEDREINYRPVNHVGH